MRVTLCPPDDLDGADVDRWTSWQRADPALASPFLSPGFVLTVARHRPAARIAVLEDAGERVGYFAFEAGRLGVGRALAYDVSDHQGVVHAPGFEWSGAELLAACGLHVWEFDHLVAAQGAAFAPQDVEVRASPVIDLTDGAEAWYAQRRAASSSRMKKARQYERRLAEQVGPVEVDYHTADEGALDLLLRWKSAQYVRTGRRDRFRQGWLTAVVRELLRTAPGGVEVVLSEMRAGGRTVSLDLCLRSGDVLAGWFPAYDTAYARYSPGLVHQLRFVRLAADAGVRTYDLGAGEAAYKETLKSHDLQVLRGRVHRPTVLAALRRAGRAPVESALAFTLARPRLRLAARRTLAGLGEVRRRFGWSGAGG